MKLTKSGQGEILRPEIERSDRREARQNSGVGWRGHKKLKKAIYYWKSEIPIIAGPNILFQKKVSAHLPGQNGDLGLYFRPVNLISPKLAEKSRNIGEMCQKFWKRSFRALLSRHTIRFTKHTRHFTNNTRLFTQNTRLLQTNKTFYTKTPEFLHNVQDFLQKTLDVH